MNLIETIAKALFDDEQDGTLLTQQRNRMMFGIPDITWADINDADRVRPETAQEYRRRAHVAMTAFIGYHPTPPHVSTDELRTLLDDPAAADLRNFGVAFTRDGKHVPATDVYLPGEHPGAKADPELNNWEGRPLG